MPSAAEIRALWLRRLFSTEPADRPRTEAAVRDLYTAVGLAAPRYILWFDSPFDAAWAVGMLDVQGNSPWRQIMRDAARRTEQRKQMESVQAELCRRIAEADWPGACTAIGAPFEDLSPDNPLPRRIFDVRATLYPSVDALWQSCSFTAAQDDLYRAELRFVGGPTGVLGTQEHTRPVSLLVSHSLRTLYPFPVIAADEAQAAGRTPPPLLAAFWKIARACGSPWWAFEHAAILTDRPVEIHRDGRYFLHRADGPAVVYRDGAKAWAWEGGAVPEDWILHPEKIPSGDLRHASTALRQHAEQRIARAKPVRKTRAARAGFLQRYLAGDHEQVWADLVALGADARKPRHADEAVEVARETMRRVEANVRTLVSRLRLLDYRFKTKGMWLDEAGARTEAILRAAEAMGQTGPAHERLRQSHERHKQERKLADYEVRAHVPPPPNTPELLEELDKQAGPVPLSLRAFYEIVGEVDLIGHHPHISPEADPLVVFPLEAMLQEIDEGDGSIAIAPDHYHKADISGGAPYEIALPDPRADAELLNEPHRLFFVDYLRLVFRHGGFPGYAGRDRDVPAEIAILSQDLQPF
jgi:hypothetical protein